MATENLWGVLSSRIHKEPESWTGRWGDGREHPHFFIHVLALNIWTQSENFKNILAIEVPTLDFIECHNLWIRYSYVRVTFLCVGCVCVCVCVCVCARALSHVWLFATHWTIPHQILLSMEFSRQEYWGGLPCPPPGDLPNPGVKLVSPVLAGRLLTTAPPGKPSFVYILT